MKLLRQELGIQKEELLESLHFASLEKIFIEERIYKDEKFEQAKDIDEACEHICSRLIPFHPQLIREVTKDDILKLMEIKMGRILKFNSDKAEENIACMKTEIEKIDKHLIGIVKYTVDWFRSIKKKYGNNFLRLTELRNFETIEAAKVVEANEKLYINKEEGFMGTSLKKDEFVSNCSDLDDVIIFYKDGRYIITPVTEKKFIGKDVIHIGIFKKDNRTIYNVVYRDGNTGPHYIKRFFVPKTVRDREYNITQGNSGTEVIYFTANPNGEAEIVRVALKKRSGMRKQSFEKDFSEIAIKGKQAVGNILTKHDVTKITLKQYGGSTLGGRKIWFDRDVLRLNHDEHGEYLGEFNENDSILVILENGEFYTTNFDLSNHYEDNVKFLKKYKPDTIWTAIICDADQNNQLYLKRFSFETSSSYNKQSFLGENKNNKLILLTSYPNPYFELTFGGEDNFRNPIIIDCEEFPIKGFKTKGKRLSTYNVKAVKEVKSVQNIDEEEYNIDGTGQLKLF
jgi:topoisomerase-4 subunit A